MTVETGVVRARAERLLDMSAADARAMEMTIATTATIVLLAGVEVPALCDALEAERERVRVLREANAELEGALDTIHRRVFSLAHDYVTLAETRQEANSLYRDMRDTIFAPMKARRAALATAGGEGATT